MQRYDSVPKGASRWSAAQKSLRRYNYLFSETNAAYHEMSARLGLSDSAAQILYTICDCGSGYRCPLHRICMETGVSKQTINSARRKMEGEGYVYLEQAGGKRKDVCLTAEGIALAERTVSKIIAAENAVFASWPPEDVERYLALTEEYLTAFRKEAKKQLNEE